MSNQIDNYVNDLEKFRKELNSVASSLNEQEKELFYHPEKIVDRKKTPLLISYAIIIIAMILIVYLLNISTEYKIFSMVTGIIVSIIIYAFIIVCIKKSVNKQRNKNSKINRLNEIKQEIKKTQDIISGYNAVITVVHDNYGATVEKALLQIESVESLAKKKHFFDDALKFLNNDEVASIILQEKSLIPISDKLKEHDRLVYKEASEQIYKYMHDYIPDIDLDKYRKQFSFGSSYLSTFKSDTRPVEERIRKKAAWQAEYDSFMKRNGSRMVDEVPTDGRTFCAYAKAEIEDGVELVQIGWHHHVAKFSKYKKPHNGDTIIISGHYYIEEITTHPVERKTVRINGQEVDVSIEREETSTYEQVKIHDWVYPSFRG